MITYNNLKIDDVEIHRIINIVVKKTNVSYDLMKDHTRESPIVQARQAAIFFIKRSNEELTLRQIGGYFGGRGHSTIIYAIEKVEEQYQVNSQFRKNMNALCEEINPDLKQKLERLIK